MNAVFVNLIFIVYQNRHIAHSSFEYIRFYLFNQNLLKLMFNI